MCWSVIPGDSLPRGDHHRPEWIAGKESSTPSRPITTRCLSSILLIHGWIKFTTALLRILIGYPREIPWRDGHSFTRKNNYHTRKPYLTIRHHRGIISWGLLPLIAGQSHVAILAGYFKYGACFSTNFHTIIYTALSTDICSHYGHAGFQPAIQQLFSMMVQTT